MNETRQLIVQKYQEKHNQNQDPIEDDADDTVNFSYENVMTNFFKFK